MKMPIRILYSEIILRLVKIFQNILEKIFYDLEAINETDKIIIYTFAEVM